MMAKKDTEFSFWGDANFFSGNLLFNFGANSLQMGEISINFKSKFILYTAK